MAIYSPLQSLHIKGSSGDPLPVVFKKLDANGTRFLRGQVVLICGAPGSAKSALALTYAVKSKVSTLYLSADSDSFTQLSRMLSIEMNWTMERSTLAVREMSLGSATDALERIPIRFSYATSPTLDMIELELAAYDELYGDYPELIVVDNLTNVVTGGEKNSEDPFAGLESLADYLNGMARETGACVLALHHVTGIYNDLDKVIPLSGVKGQISRVPAMILTLHRAPGQLRVSTVKNRHNRFNPSGLDFVSLGFDGDSMRITG